MREWTLSDRLRILSVAEELEADALQRHQAATKAAREAAEESQRTALELRRSVKRRQEAERWL